MGSGAAGEAVPLQADLAEIAFPAVVSARETVQAVVPPTPLPPIGDERFIECATNLIVQWEISGPTVYMRKYEGVIWPGGASGPTWGIGYDGGHQTRATISLDWRAHGAVARLSDTAGVVGQPARDRVRGGEWRGVVTPYPYAAQVFGDSTLPTYTAAARRAFGPPFDQQPATTRCSLVSLVYNRGGQMGGDRRREMRSIRDTCLPAADAACVARELVSMCRLWAGTPNGPGLCARRKDEAATVLQ